MNVAKNSSIGDSLNVWFREYATKKLRASTYECYFYARKRAQKEWPDIESLHPEQITAITFQEFLDHLGDQSYGWSSINHIKCLYSKLFAFCMRYGICKANPARAAEISRAAPKESGQPLTKIELQKIEFHAPKMKTIDIFTVQFLRYTGLRKSELFRLKWRDIDFEQQYFSVNKSKTKKGERCIPLIPETHIILQAMQNYNLNQKYVFCQSNGMQLTKEALNGICHRVADIAGIKRFTPHMLRHTLATELVEKQVDYKSISELLGHKSVAFTMQTYVHHDIEYLRSGLMKISQK